MNVDTRIWMLIFALTPITFYFQGTENAFNFLSYAAIPLVYHSILDLITLLKEEWNKGD